MIATHNPGKLREMRELLAPYGIEADVGRRARPGRARGDRHDFGANARIKAQAAAKRRGLPAFADDSGLAVDALGGEPGIYSARWAGPDKDFRHAMQTVEDKLRALRRASPERRRAHFVSALCVAWPDGHVEEFEAQGRRHAGLAAARRPGFGYDPMFLPDGHDPHLRRDDRPRKSTACRRAAKGCRTGRAPSSSSRSCLRRRP